MLGTPVGFFVFNRPDATARVFERIRAAKPRMLLLVADGARDDAEQERVLEVRRIIRKVDWKCDVRTNFSAENLGCRKRMSSGLDWVFRQAEEAIILEDDCVPDPSFFPYCDELLGRYRDDDRIMHIGGVNAQFGLRVAPESYFFSAINMIWGWATWRRAWLHYDEAMTRWPQVRDAPMIKDLFGEAIAAKFVVAFDNVHSGKTDTWDSQWTLAVWLANGLSILPSVNLISNIGFGPGATHTKKADSAVANQATVPVEMPLIHPIVIERNRGADDQAFQNLIAAKAM